jgi:hypothetical protein
LILGVTAGGEVENDAGLAILKTAGVGIADAELRLANSGGPHDDGEGAGDEAASESFVEFGDTSRVPRPGHVEIC